MLLIKYNTFATRSFSHATVKLWNALLTNIWECKTLDKLKSSLKTHLYRKTFNLQACTHYWLLYVKLMYKHYKLPSLYKVHVKMLQSVRFILHSINVLIIIIIIIIILFQCTAVYTDLFFSNQVINNTFMNIKFEEIFCCYICRLRYSNSFISWKCYSSEIVWSPFMNSIPLPQWLPSSTLSSSSCTYSMKFLTFCIILNTSLIIYIFHTKSWTIWFILDSHLTLCIFHTKVRIIWCTLDSGLTPCIFNMKFWTIFFILYKLFSGLSFSCSGKFSFSILWSGHILVYWWRWWWCNL